LTELLKGVLSWDARDPAREHVFHATILFTSEELNRGYIKILLVSSLINEISVVIL
jgi:hypothetical protein